MGHSQTTNIQKEAEKCSNHWREPSTEWFFTPLRSQGLTRVANVLRNGDDSTYTAILVRSPKLPQRLV
ncbi:MAG: hypothetical protein QXS26_04665 [Thermosphaera sp.]